MDKACPVILRRNKNKLDLLAFQHPDGSFQLVKGNIKKGEPLDTACARELHEESGINAVVSRQLGTWQPALKNQTWGFCLMHYEGILPDTWHFDTKDDGGHRFNFFWQPLDSPLRGNWKKVSKEAFYFIKNVL